MALKELQNIAMSRGIVIFIDEYDLLVGKFILCALIVENDIIRERIKYEPNINRVTIKQSMFNRIKTEPIFEDIFSKYNIRGPFKYYGFQKNTGTDSVKNPYIDKAGNPTYKTSNFKEIEENATDKEKERIKYRAFDVIKNYIQNNALHNIYIVDSEKTTRYSIDITKTIDDVIKTINDKTKKFPINIIYENNNQAIQDSKELANYLRKVAAKKKA